MTTNAYIITTSGVVVTVNGKPYTASNSHTNYDDIIYAIKENDFDAIPDLINITSQVATALKNQTTSDVEVDLVAGLVKYQGEEIHNTLVSRILDMVADRFDVAPMCNFLSNLMQNPSKRAVDELYGFLEAGNLPITEDGHFLAYKKIRNNYYDCHTGAVLNKPAALMTEQEKSVVHKAGNVTTKVVDGVTVVSMPRNAVDDNRDNTCSDGLHFCSQAYLKHFGGDRLVVLKINPKDVVSIPSDYNDTKGRTCSYQVIDELTEDTKERATTENVLSATVVTSQSNLNVSKQYVDGYIQGYKEGKAKQTNYMVQYSDGDWSAGYIAGAKDGRGHKPKLYK